jgi:hypothetical protein
MKSHVPAGASHSGAREATAHHARYVNTPSKFHHRASWPVPLVGVPTCHRLAPSLLGAWEILHNKNKKFLVESWSTGAAVSLVFTTGPVTQTNRNSVVFTLCHSLGALSNFFAHHAHANARAAMSQAHDILAL